MRRTACSPSTSWNAHREAVPVGPGATRVVEPVHEDCCLSSKRSSASACPADSLWSWMEAAAGRWSPSLRHCDLEHAVPAAASRVSLQVLISSGSCCADEAGLAPAGSRASLHTVLLHSRSASSFCICPCRTFFGRFGPTAK